MGGPPGDPPSQVVSTDGGAHTGFDPMSGRVSLHVVQPPGPGTELGSRQVQSVSPDGSTGTNSNTNSIFLACAPFIFCRTCGVTFQPQVGVECDSLCDACVSLPPAKRVKHGTAAHRLAGPPS